MKIAAIFIILLVVLLPVMSFSMTGDGTLKGRLQSFVSYGFGLTSFLLCLLTIAVSVYSVTSEFMQKQIYTVLTKPIRRFQFLLGKLLGVILLDVVLLALFSSVIYLITIYIPKFTGASQEELKEARNEFYTARAALTVPEADVTKEVNDDYDKLKKTGQLEQVFPNTSSEQIKSYLTSRKQLEKRAAEVGRDLLWEFNNVRPLGPKESLFIRFKYDVSVNPPDLQVYSRWFAGDYRQIKYGTGIETPIYSFDRKDLIRTFYEIEVPADAVAKDGYLAVGFLNVPLNNTVVIFPLEDGLEVLYKADTFTANFLRAVLLISFRLIFLACLGILSSSFLSFPVAVLLCLVVFFTGAISGFILESFGYLSSHIDLIYRYTIKLVVLALPQFDKYSPGTFLVPARLISWSLLARVACLMVCIKAVLLFVLSLIIFSFREIAKITV